MDTKSLPEEIVNNRILKKCYDANFTFIRFNNSENNYVNIKTKLKLKCNKCGYEWDTTTYDKLMARENKCLKCCKKIKLTEDEKIKKITERCKELNYTFNGFTDKTKLKLKCNKCGYEWDTTTYGNFLKKDRNSHKCGKKTLQVCRQILKIKKTLLIELIKN